MHDVKLIDSDIADSENPEQTLTEMSNKDYEWLIASLPADTARLKPTQFLSYLFNHQEENNFDKTFDSTLENISNLNKAIFFTVPTPKISFILRKTLFNVQLCQKIKAGSFNLIT